MRVHVSVSGCDAPPAQWQWPHTIARACLLRPDAGITRSTLWLPVTPDSSFCAASVFWLLALDVVLYAALTWWCDKVSAAASAHASTEVCGAVIRQWCASQQEVLQCGVC
jgi:hypothetical protein